MVNCLMNIFFKSFWGTYCITMFAGLPVFIINSAFNIFFSNNLITFYIIQKKLIQTTKNKVERKSKKFLKENERVKKRKRKKDYNKK